MKTRPRSADLARSGGEDRRRPVARPGDAEGDHPGEGDPAESLALTVAAVARRLGVAPATLRTWDRRYGVGPSGHTTGRHRRYGPDDIARLELMQRALLRGASPAEAARYALASTSPRTANGAEQPVPDGTTAVKVLDRSIDEAEAEPERPTSSGMRGLRMPGASRPARGLGRAVLAMDSAGAQGVLADAIAATGVCAAWDEVIRPVMTAIARRWEHSGGGIEVEHLLYECVLAALLKATPVVHAPRNPRPVLLACAPAERHSLPLYGLVAALAGRDMGVRMLGAALPAPALSAAVRRIAPAAVVLWAQLPRNADPALLDGLPRTRQRSRVFLGGPGWRMAEVDRTFELPDGLAAAADEIERSVLGS